MNPEFANIFLLEESSYISMNYWLAIGILMIVSVLGALVPIPIPYILPAAFFAEAWYFSNNVEYPLISIIVMILFAALGNALGDFLDYLIGDGAGHVMSKDDPEITDKWSQRILKKPKAIPWIIACFGMTPLPDSLLLCGGKK